jgi:hypothetical protein
MANKRPLVLDDVGSGAGALREAGDGECANLINSPYCTYGGTANAITLTVNDSLGKPSAYVAGAQYRFRASAVNTGAATVNIEGLGAKALVTVTGVALPAGYIRTGVDTTITYDAVGDRFVAGREVESGNNANGYFFRYASGRQVSEKQTTLIVTSPGTYFSNSGTLSASFTLITNLMYSINDTNAGPTTAFVVLKATGASTYNLYGTANVVNTLSLSIRAEGFWY